MKKTLRKNFRLSERMFMVVALFRKLALGERNNDPVDVREVFIATAEVICAISILILLLL